MSVVAYFTYPPPPTSNSMTATLIQLAGVILNTPAVHGLTVHNLTTFIRLLKHLKHEIALYSPSNGATGPPHSLPVYLNTLMAGFLDVGVDEMLTMWHCFKDYIWFEIENESQLRLSPDEEKRLTSYGTQSERVEQHVVGIMLYPPQHTCIRCGLQFKLSTMSRVQVLVYSASTGLMGRRAYSSSFKCQECHIRYYHNHYVVNGTRVYYGPAYIPQFIQIEDHAFVEHALCELFTTQMLYAWVSSQNCAKIFNAIANLHEGVSVLSSEQVFRAFAYNALLRHHYELRRPLTIQNGGDNDHRLKLAMEARNSYIIRNGQEEVMHACSTCERQWISGPGYKGLRSFRAVVTDGITLGHPCCKVHNCPNPLPNNRAHFCEDHKDRKKTCVVVECKVVAEEGFGTCTDPAHRLLETTRNEKKRAFFQLQKRLQRPLHESAQLADPMGRVEEVEWDEPGLEDEGKDTGKPEEGNKPPKARFARRRSHNEQLIVSCCGVIIARATMFGAEAVSAVKDMFKSVYRCPEDLPDVGFYDDACHWQAHLQKEQDTYFKDMILPVDVFHFKSKHKESDEFCQKNCNPAMWKELFDKDNNWVFNSSAAEQVNVWMGGYLAIVRDMLADRYNFFLDEMIKRRNEVLIKQLYEKGKVPYHIPFYKAQEGLEE
ncbi:hypothetical protein BDN72DRAFT_906089 [Pluteus cervinus]|uniref:Uncharacterized protein n=1 Tax=Pluteus cervinus TaxID=181527 RepID=A0ACD3A003_9AGAR|nr:hypothetical protein BDN72DRAFT_906089 [Pluteus cervinus]